MGEQENLTTATGTENIATTSITEVVAAEGAAQETLTGSAVGTAESKTYSETELNQLKADWEKEWQKKLIEATAAGKQAGLSEAERLARLTETERLQEKLKTAQAENEQYKAEENRRNLEAEAVKSLTAQGLPEAFSKMVMGENAEMIKANITAVKEVFHQAVQAEVANRIKGKTPAAGGNGGMSEEESIKAEVARIMKGAR